MELRAQLTALGFDRGACPIGKEEPDESTAATTIAAGAVEQGSSAEPRRGQRATIRTQSARRDPPGRRRNRSVTGTRGRR